VRRIDAAGARSLIRKPQSVRWTYIADPFAHDIKNRKETRLAETKRALISRLDFLAAIQRAPRRFADRQKTGRFSGVEVTGYLPLIAMLDRSVAASIGTPASLRSE
jgi:hypothetical protein